LNFEVFLWTSAPKRVIFSEKTVPKLPRYV
jgi:hypothetical protein